MGKGAGLVLGLLFGWGAVIALNEAGLKLAQYRAQLFNEDLGKTAPWLAVIVAAGIILGLVLGARGGFGAGALTGAGLLMTAAGLAVQLVPIRTAVDLTEWFEWPGGRRNFGYTLWDGSILFIGLILLVVGLMRMRSVGSKPQYPQGPYPGPVPQQFGGPQDRT